MGEISEVVRIEIVVDGADTGARDVNITQDSIDKLTASLGNFRKKASDDGKVIKQTFSEIRETVQKQLTTPLEEASTTLTEVRNSQKLLNAEFAKSPLPSQRKEIAALRREVDQLEKELLETAEAQDLFGKKAQATAGVTNSANFAFIQLGRGIEDIRFGFENAINNIDPVITAVQRFKLEAQASGVSLRQGLLSALGGPAGLLFIGQSILTLFTLLGPKIEEVFANGAEEATDFNDVLEEAINSIITFEELELEIKINRDQIGVFRQDIARAIEDAEAELANLQAQQRASLVGSGFRSGFQGAAAFDQARIRAQEELNEAREEDVAILEKAIEKLREQAELLRVAEKTTQLLNQATGAGGFIGPVLTDDERKFLEVELPKRRAQLEEDLAEIRRGLIEDNEKRAIAAIRAEFAERRNQARAASAGADSFAEIARLEERSVSQVRREFREEREDAEREFNKELLDLQREFAILSGANQADLLEEQLANIDARIEGEKLSVEEERELLLERTRIIIQLEELRIKTARDEEQRQERLNRLRQRQVDQQRQFSQQIATAERNLRVQTGGDRLQILRETEQQVRAQLQVEIQAARERETLLENQIGKERELLQEQIRNARIQQQLQLESLSLQQQIAKEEERILEGRTRQVEQFTNVITDSILEFRDRQRTLTDFDIQAERRQLRLREEELKESLRRNLIDQTEYSFELRQIQQDRAQFEQQVEEERTTFLQTLRKGFTDFLIEEGLRQLGAFIARQTAELLFSKGAQAAATASTVASMTAIGTAAAPAAAATSIATFGGAAAAGGAAATATILSISALVAGIQAGAAALGGAGFKEGGAVGYTGDGDKHRFADFVHGGEYVFPEHLVRGNLSAFRMLHGMMERRQVSIDHMLAMMGLRGFIDGGFVPSGVATPAFAPPVAINTSATTQGGEIRRLSADVGKLASAVLAVANRPNQVVVTPRSSRQINKAASLRERKVLPRRFRT